MSDEPSPFTDPSDYDAEPPNGGRVERKSHLRLLPQAQETEKAFISALLILPKYVLGICLEMGMKPDWLFDTRHVLIYTAVVGMDASRKAVDFITVTDFLRDCAELDNAGGVAYVTELFTFMPTAANARHYLETLKEKADLRSIIQAGTEFATKAYDASEDVQGLVDGFEAAVLAIRQQRKAITTHTAREVASEAYESIVWRANNRGVIRGLPTGFPAVDLATDGLGRQEFIVLASRPGIGKTALALNIAEYLTVVCNVPVAVFSLEMSKGQLGERLLYSRAEVNSVKVRAHGIDNTELRCIEGARDSISRAPLYIEEASDLTIQEFRGRARRLVSDHKVQAIFVDSMSAMKSSSRQAAEKREREAADCSTGFKQCAKELGIPIVVICHLGRDYEKRGGGRARLSDLRDSGAIEQDADTVCFLEPQDDESEVIDLFYPKMRNGEKGTTIPLYYRKQFTRFYPIEDERTHEQVKLPI